MLKKLLIVFSIFIISNNQQAGTESIDICFNYRTNAIDIQTFYVWVVCIHRQLTRSYRD